MRIVKIAAHSCVRLHKMALALMQAPYKHHISLMSQRETNFQDSYDIFAINNSIHQLRECIKVLDPLTDIYHCHNEPSFFVTIVKELTDKPVVLDVHDSWLARVTPEQWEERKEAGKKAIRITTEERNNFQLADALVFPSKPFADNIINEFALDQPYIVLPPYVPHNLFNYTSCEYYGGLVYEGRVDLKNSLTEKFEAGFEYTDYEELAKKCFELDLEFHIYASGKDDYWETYKEIAIPHKPVKYMKLMDSLALHDWGLVGNIHYTPEWEVAMPNKLFEYIAAGVPIVSINAKHCSEFIEEHGIGITVNSMEELRDRWREHRDCRKRLLRVRGQFTMEKNIHVLDDLYNKITSHGGGNGNRQSVMEKEEICL
jgi:glycosyltransferase involved in cell wall biosynthesis